MSGFELASSLRDLSRELERIANQAAELRLEPEAEHRELVPHEILRGPGKLETMGFAPGYRNATLVLQMQAGQRLEVCLSIRDSRFLHEELSSMLELAGPHPLDERSQTGGRS